MIIYFLFSLDDWDECEIEIDFELLVIEISEPNLYSRQKNSQYEDLVLCGTQDKWNTMISLNLEKQLSFLLCLVFVVFILIVTNRLLPDSVVRLFIWNKH